jgi:predicted SnoaL-like aldol condensation-catalyzing enzyme
VGANMTLGNELSMNFFISKSVIDETKDYYVQVTKTYADGREDVTRYFAKDEWLTLGSNYYVEFDGIAAKEMNDAIYVQVFYADHTPVSTLWNDSVVNYVARILEDHDDKTKTMLVDMLNYGAAAQLHFGYDTDNLANSRLTDAQKAYATESVVMNDYREKGDNYYGSNLELGNEIVLGLYFKNVDETMYAMITYTDHYGKAQSVRVEGSDFLKSGALYRIPVKSLVIADARKNVTCTVYAADGTVVGSCVDSVESYIARMSETGALYEAIMKFADSAYKHFHG